MSGTFVYFAGPSTEGLIKVGCSYCPERRIRQFTRAGEPSLVLLATLRGDQKLEGRFHEALAADRVSGEWFADSGVIREMIAAINSGTFDTAALPMGKSRIRSDSAARTWERRRAAVGA